MRFVESMIGGGVLFLLALSASPTSLAEAQGSSASRTIVLRFQGRGAAQAREAVLRDVAPLVELVSEETAVATAQDLGIDVSSPDGMTRVVEELGISLIVYGAVQGRGRRATTTIEVVDSRGETLATREAPGPARASDRPEIGRLAAEAIEEAEAVLERRRLEAEAAARPPPPPEPEVIIYDDEEEEEEPLDSTRWRHPFLAAMVGLRLRTGATHVTDTSGFQNRFDAEMYPEIEIDAALRPLTDDGDEALRGIFIGLRGSFSVGERYASRDDTLATMTSYRFQLDAGYGYTIANVFELQGMVGFGSDGVLLDTPMGVAAKDFPSTSLSYLRLGVAGRVRAYQDVFIVEAGLGGRVAVDVGEIAAAFGPSAFFGGMDVTLGVGGVVSPGLTYAVRFGYALHALEFSGGGGTNAAGTSGTDESIELRLLVGYSF